MVERSRPERAELLLPAGDLAKLRTAVLYGADAVYAGTPDLSLRTQSGFGIAELEEGIRFAHAHGKRVYLTLNLFAHNKDVARLPEFVATLRRLGPDGVIVADLGIAGYLREHAPELELHVSTQANVTSHLAVEAWRRQGASLVVLAREMSFEELVEIREKCPEMRLETFVHGSMCMTYSGRCLLSNYMAERGANQGSCAHSCRWKYKLKVAAPDGSVGEIEITDENKSEFQFFLEEEFRPGQLYPIEEDEHGSYILNSKDLCLMPELASYLRLGIDSLKVEGRNKSAYYVAVVGRAYRAAIDAYYRDPATFDPKPYFAELSTVASRGYTLGFHSGRLDGTAHDFDGGQSLSDFEFAGVVREVRESDFVVEVKNRLEAGDVLEFLPPDSIDVIRLRLYEFVREETGEQALKVTAGENRAIRVSFSSFHAEDEVDLRRRLPELSVVRKAKALTLEQRSQIDRTRAALSVEQGLLPATALVRGEELRAKAKGATKPPRLGEAGCCGLGCNGCLPFWNDARYEKARALLEGSRLRKLRRGDSTPRNVDAEALR